MSKRDARGRLIPVPAIDRFNANTTEGPVSLANPDLGPCLLWTGRLEANGYARFAVEGRKRVQVHRWVWTEAHGPIPDDWDVDHLCFVRHCVRLEHLDAVTRSENSTRREAYAVRRRNGTCRRGHRTYSVSASGVKRCLECQRENTAAYRERLRSRSVT